MLNHSQILSIFSGHKLFARNGFGITQYIYIQIGDSTPDCFSQQTERTLANKVAFSSFLHTLVAR